ncbi:MAG: sugar phosphate isomerase/epimerase [Planctomycetes bacterium]|nr:sugar phosphate isomerase/epimerase [Planctomycetota bacterium]
MAYTVTQSHVVSRRMFCGAALAAVAVPLTQVSARAGQGGGVKFYKNFSGGHIGVKANQQQALEYAVKYGFGGIAPSDGEFANKSAAEIGEWLARMKQKGIRYGSAGLPVEFRRDEERFRTDLAQFPKRAALLKQLGVTRVATWITPGHNELTYLQNFKMLETRFREVAKVLQDNDIRLGLEFVGPRTSREKFRFPFACTQVDMMELVHAVGTGNVGLLLDSWHWYTSHGTVDELLRLSNKDIVHVHVNDAPAGIEVDQQIDSRRQLPATTGVIDLKGFINALVKIGYDGPVECEPFDQELRKMDPAAAVQTTAESLHRLWGLMGA